MSSEAPCCFALGPMDTSTLHNTAWNATANPPSLPTPPRPGWWQHQRNSNWPLHGLETFSSCPVRTPTKLPSRAPKWLKWPYRTHIWRWKTRNGDQWVIDDLSLLVLGQGEYPLKLVTPKLVARSMVTNSQEITNITCILVTSNVGQLNMWVLYKKNGPTRAKKLSLAQLDQIQMAQMAIITIRIQHCALAQKGLQTRNGDQFVSFCLPFFYPNLWNLIWRWPTWTGHRRPQTTHNEHQLDVAQSSSWPSSCKSCIQKIGPTGAKKPSM